MNKALMQLEGVTQQNAALVEQAAASALTFKDEAGKLFQLVGRFQLEEGTFAATPEPRAPEAPRSAPMARQPARELGFRPKPAKPDNDDWQEF
jgi:methyl-accepting chemotaxis protein